jgi:hypothetical protein
MRKQETLFLTMVGAMFVAVAVVTAWHFLLQKNYDFVVEAPCDPSSATCYERDCDEEECPVNGLEQYRVYTVKAAEFAHCADETCVQECSQGTITCTETLCGEGEEDVCSIAEADAEEPSLENE